MNNYDYPVGADTKDAPWNKKENEPREIEVLVSITMSKSFKIKVDDYDILGEGRDEDGDYYQDVSFKNCNLIGAVEEQTTLPQDAHKWVVPFTLTDAKAKSDLENWNVDEIEVIKES